MGDGDGDGQLHLVFDFARQPRPHFVLGQPARILDLVAVDAEVVRSAPPHSSPASGMTETARAGWRDSAPRPPSGSPLPSVRAAPLLPCSRPVRQNRQRRNKAPAESACCGPPGMRSPRSGSMITTGSVRGKCSAPQAGHSAAIAAIHQLRGMAAIGAEAVALVPVQQRLGLAGDGGVARRQHKGGGAHFRECRLRRARLAYSTGKINGEQGLGRHPGPETRTDMSSHSARQAQKHGAVCTHQGAVLPERQEQSGGFLRRQPGRIGAFQRRRGPADCRQRRWGSHPSGKIFTAFLFRHSGHG